MKPPLFGHSNRQFSMTKFGRPEVCEILIGLDRYCRRRGVCLKTAAILVHLMVVFATMSVFQFESGSPEPLWEDQVMRLENGTHIIVYELSDYLSPTSLPVFDIITQGVEFITLEDEVVNLTSDGSYLTVKCNRPYTNGMGCNFAGASLEGIPGYSRGLWVDFIVNYTLGIGGNETSLENCLYDNLGRVVLGDGKASITVGFYKAQDPANLPWIEWEKDFYEVKAGETVVLNATATSPLVFFRTDYDGDTIPDTSWDWSLSGSYSTSHVYYKDGLACVRAWDGYQFGQNHSDTDCAHVMVYDTLPRPPTNLNALLSGEDSENVTVTWTLSLDDGQGKMNVIQYDLYRGENYSSNVSFYQFLDSVSNGTSVYIDTNVGEGDPNNHFYVVCAVDLNSNSSCANRQAGKFTRPLLEGPSLVSIPLILFDQNIESELRTVSFDKAWYYDSNRGEWKTLMKLKTYRGTLSQVFHTMGLWLSVTEDCNLTAAGVVPSHTELQLHIGWNLVSFPSFRANYTVGDLKTDINVNRVEGFDPSQMPYFLRVMQDEEYLKAGHAYWIETTEDGLWLVNN